jgi:hypothetical protein
VVEPAAKVVLQNKLAKSREKLQELQSIVKAKSEFSDGVWMRA